MTSKLSHQPTSAFAELDAAAPVDLVQMLRLVWVGKWIIALATGLSVLVAGYYGFAIAPPRYAAVTVIDTKVTPAPVLPQGAATEIAPQPATQMQVLLATATLQQVIDRLDLRLDPAFNRYLAPVRPLSVTGVRTSLRNLLQGQIETPPDTPAITSKLVQNLRGTISLDHLRDSDLLLVTITAGNPERAVSIANTLVSVYLDDQQTRKADRAAAATVWLTDRSAELRSQQSKIEAAISHLIAQAGLQDPARHDTLGRQLLDTESRLTAAEAAFLRASDAANRQRLTSQIAALQASRDDLALQVQLLSDARNTRDRMQLDLDANLAQQADYQGHLRDLALHAGQIGPDARVLNAATEARYIGPQKLLLMQIAAVVGALGGLMLVALQQILRRGFSDEQDLQDRTGLPVLAQLPQMPSRRPARLVDTLCAAGASAATEGYRHLRTALVLQSTPPQVILSTSAIPGEGKTTQAIGLAHALAMLGKSVLLIDADLRQGSFHKFFRLAQTDGLAAVILGHIPLQDATEPSPLPGVDLLAGGAHDASQAEFLYTTALADVLALARRRYDFIVIDAPPVVPVPDALVLASHADAVIFAVRWDKTPAALVLAATQKLAAANVQITGLTLTQINRRKQAQRGGFSFARYGRGYFQS